MKRDDKTNIVHATLDELINLGYSKLEVALDDKGRVKAPPIGSLLCLTNKSRDLWCELSAADIKESKVTPDKFVILCK